MEYFEKFASRIFTALCKYGILKICKPQRRALSMPLTEELLNQLDTYIQNHYRHISYSVRCTPPPQPTPEEIEAAIKEKEIFSEYFFTLLAEKGLSDVEAYKKARIDRRMFSKIRSQKDYMPSKKTLLAFVIALELNLDEANELLKHGGYYLSNTRKDDVIIEYFLESKCYDFDLINEALAHYGYSTLTD